MRVIIAGGGTGGHLVPALAVAGELRRRGHEVPLLVGTRGGLEARLAARYGLPLETIEVGALNRVGAGKAATTLLRLPCSFWQAGRVLDAFQPQVAYGLGGYASGPVLLMAAMRNIPVVIHEPNAVPGLANRAIAPFVSRALVTFVETQRFFPASRVEIVGVPVRAEFFGVPPKTHQPPFTILIFGGSQGAHRINRAVMDSLPLFAQWGQASPAVPGGLEGSSKNSSLFFIHQTGEKDYPDVQASFARNGLACQAEVLPFVEDMPAAFARADLLVCRAGASTVAEITAAGKAAILVPFPFAADDHQLQNARALERSGAARVLPDRELDGQRLFAHVCELMPRLGEMEQNSRARGQPGAAARTVDVLERVALHVP